MPVSEKRLARKNAGTRVGALGKAFPRAPTAVQKGFWPASIYRASMAKTTRAKGEPIRDQVLTDQVLTEQILTKWTRQGGRAGGVSPRVEEQADRGARQPPEVHQAIGL